MFALGLENRLIPCTFAPGNHSLLVETLIAHGKMLCKDDPYNPFDREIKPEDATLIFYGHGDTEEYDEDWISIAELIKISVNIIIGIINN